MSRAVVAGFLAVASAACRGPAAPPAVGRPTPEILFSVEDRGELRAARSRGDVVVLAFFTTWCPSSVATMRAVDDLRARHGPLGFSSVAVSEGDTPAAIEGFVVKTKLQTPVGVDTGGAVATEMGFITIPTLIVIDRAGIVRHVHAGYHGEEDRSALDREVAALLLEPPP